MSEGIWIGDHQTTDEERQEIERNYQAWKNGTTQPDNGGGEVSGNEGGYYAGQMPQVEQPVQQQPEYIPSEEAAQPIEQQPAPQPSPLWLADPVNFTAVEDKYKDPNYQDEHWSREQIEALGSEFAYRNQGKPRDQWEPLYDDNEFVVKEMSKWYDPIAEQQQEKARNKYAIEEYYTPQTEEEKSFFQDREAKSWDDLKWWQKGLYAFFPGQSDEGLGDAPDWTKKTRDAATALQSAGSGAAFLKILGTGVGMLGGEAAAAVLTNPWVLAAAAVGMGGLLYYQARTGKELPVVNKIAELTDLPDTLTEHAIGTMIQAGGVLGKNLEQAKADPNDAYGLMAAINDTVKEVTSFGKDMWNASEYTYEMYGGIGDIVIDAANWLFEGGAEGTKLGEAWMFNKGESEKVQLAEGTYAYSGLETIRNLYGRMREQNPDLSDDVINSLIQAGVIESSGTTGAVSDNLWQSIIDVSALAPGFENSVAEKFSKAVGFETGVQAAQANKASSRISDIPLIGTVYNGLTGNKPSGGVNEWSEHTKNLVRTKDVSELTALDRYFGGLDEQGRIKQLLPIERQSAMDFLPETKVLGADNIAMNVINSQMADAQTDVEVQAVLDNYVNGTEGIYNSPDVVTTREAVAAGRARADVYFQRYRDGEQGRIYLKTVADALGMEQKDIITMAETNPDVLTKRMQDHAARNDGKIGTIDVSQAENVTNVLKGFTGKNALLWNINQLKAMTTGAVFDGMNEFNIKKYGVKPDHFVVQMADTMKSAQSLMLLGLSPSYLVNNVINNTVTSIAEGVFGLMTPAQMQSLFDEMGIVPARLGETLSEFRGMDGSMSSLDAMNQRISEAKRTQGLLSDVRNAIRKANGKAGVFSSVSGKFEELQGKQVTATAINQYWRQTWKAGVGFQAMPEVLVNRIEAQNPGMTNMIYLAVERGMNMKAITQSLYGEYIHADVRSVLKDVIAEQFPGDPTVFDEVFGKSNIINEIEAAFAMCSTEEERARALNRIRENTRQFVNNLKRNELIDRAESIKNMVDAEGVNAAQNILGEMAINRAQTWLLTRDEWGDLYKKIAEEKYKGPERAALISALNMKQRTAWEAQYAYEMQVLKGIMDGLGFETETNAQYIDTTIQLNNSWQDFYKEKDRQAKETQLRIQRRIDRMSQSEIESGAIMVVVNEEWNRYYDETEALYKEYYGKEREYQRQLDDLFVKGYEKATGKSGEQIAQNLANIRDIRQQMATMQQEAHSKTRNMTDNQKAKFYAEFDPKYNALIVEIEKLQKATGTLIDAEEGKGYTDNDGAKMTVEQTVRANEAVETSNTERERAIREKIGYMSRDEIRQGWIDAGRTDREADLMMVLYDQIAETWAKNTGKDKADFFSEAAKLKGIANWMLGGTSAMLEDSEGNLYQVDAIRPADINTDKFRIWFRNSKIVDANGKPLIVYHGTAEQFEVFRKQKANDKLGRSMGLGLGKDKFYLTTERAAGEAFARSAESLGRGKNPQVMELYVSIQNPIMQSEYESRLAQKYLQFKNSDPRQPGYDYRARDRAIAALDREIKAEGYDGIWDQDSGQIAVFEPTQIKSIYNGGDWSPFDPNILKQKYSSYEEFISKHYLINPNFMAWWKDSKVCDKEKRPIVVHHGSPYEFTTFRKDLLGITTNAESALEGIFFTKNESTAEHYQHYNAWKIFREIIGKKNIDLESEIDLNNIDGMLNDYKNIVNYLKNTNIWEYADKEGFVSYEEYADQFERIRSSISRGMKSEKSLIDAARNLQSETEQLESLYGMSEKIREEEGYIYHEFLSIQNPHKVNCKGKNGKINYTKEIQHAKKTGKDGVIFENVINSKGEPDTIYVVFEPNQIKSIYNNGQFSLKNNDTLYQNMSDVIKGTFEHSDMGNIIRMLQASDVSTMVHESGHLFRRTLNEQNMKDFTQWAGFKDVTEFQTLEARYWANDPTLTDAERQRYVDAEEKFARGFEQYLIDGSAPTVGLKAVFKEFSRFLLSIYKNIKDLAVKDYSQQGEFVFDGPNGREVLNINAEINGIKLRDIFDRMLANGEIERTSGYTEAVQQQVSDMKMTRARMKPEAQQRRAMMEINQRVLSNWNSLAEAETFLNNMKQPIEIDGLSVDDVFLYDVINSAKSDPKMNPFSDTEQHTLTGTQTYGYSNMDPNKKYQFRYKIVELDDLVPSNILMGDLLPINEDYPAELQPRARDTVQSRNQVYSIASNLNPGKIIDDMKNISSGAPTIGEGNMYVEAGNGRILALQKARQDFPESWKNYQEYLRSNAEYIGIDPTALDSFESPVLVRERLGGNATDFIMDANSRDTLDYSASESAINDASNLNMATLGMLDIQPGEGIDTFTTEKNARAATEWLRSLPDNERAAYMTTNRFGDMVLTMEGKNRFINALFASLYATSENLNIIKSFSETSDSNIQTLESAMKATLPEMTRAEGLIRTGSRDASFSITEDVVAAAGLLQEARKANQNIHDYLAQTTIPGMERWTPTQALLAGFFGDAKNNVRMLKDFFNVYGEEVFKSGDPNQLSLISDSRTREQIIDTAIQVALDNRAKEVMNGDAASDATPIGPGLNQVNANQSAEYTSNLKRNFQQTFDEGMAIPFDKIDDIKLRGADDILYGRLLQSKVDEISKAQGYTDAQSEYAARYLDWKMTGERGEEPHAATPMIEDRVRNDIDRIISQGAEDLNEMKDLRRPGKEVDDTPVPNQGVYIKQVYAFQHGDYMIAANVYVDGEFLGYLPEDLSRMDRTVKGDNGVIYKTLAIDPDDSRGLVYDDAMAEEVRSVVPGKVDGIDGPQEPKEFMRPAKQGTTPDVMPIGSSYEEVFNKYLDPIMDKFGAAFETAETDARTKNFGGLDLETRALIEKWLDNNVKQDMAENKYRAVKYSDMKKDAAMLNYNERYGFDPVLTILSPYQFWYTRSMWQWAKRMIDKPRWHQMYSRMEDLEEENRQEIMPSRLEGKFRIPMPWLPEWMGGGYYIDLTSQLFPFSQFGESYGSNVTQSVINAKTESLLNEQYESQLITYEQMQEALSKKSGAVWENAYTQAEQEANSDQMKDTLLSQFYSPNIFWSWFKKKQNGEDPGMLTSTRTGNALKTLTSGTGLEGIGGAIGDAMTLPERALRKLYGMEYNEFGSYGDQQIRKQISQMCADGEITWRQALNAMNEKSGTIWNMAADRQRHENEMRVPLFAGAEAIKSFTKGEANFGDVIGALGASLLGGQFFPTGERELREMKAAKDQAYVDKANGDTEAVNRWYDENPEYLTRQATYIDDPEELLKFTLYNNITDIYYAQPYAQQQGIKNQLGPEFAAAILNSETRNYKAVPVQKLAEWNARIGGSTPNVGSIDVEGVERVMKYSEPVNNAVDTYYTERDQYFPGISVIQDGYYAVPKDQRKSYLNYFPQLSTYWDWNRDYKNRHPEFTFWNEQRSVYYNEETCYNSYADMSEFTQQSLEYAKVTKEDLNDTARYELMKLYQRYANQNFVSFDDYVELLQNWE